MIERLLRLTAVAIAVAALLDPPLTVAARQLPRLAIMLQRPGDPVSLGVRERLTRDLRADFEVAGPDREAAAAVVIGSEYPDRADAFPPRTSTVTLDADPRGGTAMIAGVRAPRAVPRGTRLQLEVTLAAPATAATSVVAVVAGPVGHPDVEVARVSHTWTAGSRRAVLTLDAMPLDLPPWHLRVRVSEASQPSMAATSDVLVEEAAPQRVLFYEPRPSWIATFVRRAIEADQRFVVSGLDYPSRGIRIVSGDSASLDQTALRAFSAVVVGGLDRLTVSDRDRLDWFLRERGGSLVLLPDARPGIAPWTEWLSGANTREALLERPSVLAVSPPLPALQASELLTFTGATVLGADGARCHGARCHGAGASCGFERASRLPDSPWGWPGSRVGRSRCVAIQGRQGLGVRSVLAICDCGRGARDAAGRGRGDRAGGRPSRRISSRRGPRPSLRLRCWRRGPASGFRTARFRRTGPVVARSGSGRLQRIVRRRLGRVQRITVSAGADGAEGTTGSAVMAVDPTARRAERLVPLSLLATSRGGIDVSPDRLADIEAYLRREVSAPPVRPTAHPMRSGWWIVPFAACLSAEWWLRRRKGLR